MRLDELQEKKTALEIQLEEIQIEILKELKKIFGGE